MNLHPHVQISIEKQLEEIADKYPGLPDPNTPSATDTISFWAWIFQKIALDHELMMMKKESQPLSDKLMSLRDHAFPDLLCVSLMLQNRFVPAWFVARVAKVAWWTHGRTNRFSGESIDLTDFTKIEPVESYDLDAHWNRVHSPNPNSPYQESSAYTIDEEFNLKKWRKLVQKIGSDMSCESYDWSPHKRYERLKGDDPCLKYMSHAGFSNLLPFEDLLFLKKHDELREVLFRLKNITVLGEFPGDDYPDEDDEDSRASIFSYLPRLYMFEAWLGARLSATKSDRRYHASAAIYWLLQSALSQAPDSDRYWCVNPHNVVQAFCSIVAEFELFSSSKEKMEFLKLFKRKCVYGSVDTARLLTSDNTKPAKWRELSVPNPHECIELFNDARSETAFRIKEIMQHGRRPARKWFN